MPACRQEGEAIHAISRLLFVAYFLEVGLLLIVVPWSAFWDRNFFIESFPLLEPFVKDNFTRGAVSGLGVVNVWAAFVELTGVLGSRRNRAAFTGS